MTARRMDGRTGMTGVASRFLLDLARTSEDVPARQWERALLQASDLVASLLSDYADPSEAVRRCLQRTVMLRIKDYIGQRLCDPGLRPPEIAAAAHISVRYLHKLFAATARYPSTSRGFAWSGHAMNSSIPASPAGPSPRSPSPADSATSAASTAPSKTPTGPAHDSCEPPARKPTPPSAAGD